MRKFVTAILLVGIVATMWIFLNREEPVSLGELMEDEQVTEIFIEDESTEKIVQITDEKLTDKIVEESSPMILKKTEDPPENIHYSLIFNQKDYKQTSILLGRKKLDIWHSDEGKNGGFFEIKGDNILLEWIKNETLDWSSP
ncbi:hypothetical protein [Sediminibacillus halophilus]|uniref:Uncharacterized protein n=1 Tax=Sediminibacillus halophilus TaxID=482461 RepID=A0A1G9W7J3_9BACI|nr:hypothetical protein [Sediminibacillus halophilus]SDM80459.1 hypothetical protein SAMN05216244_3459 [Sediminibacillus halophilus]